MNKHHVKGTMKDMAGKVQERVGAMTGNEKQQLKGLTKQAEGKIEKVAGDVKQAATDANKRDGR